MADDKDKESDAEAKSGELLPSDQLEPETLVDLAEILGTALQEMSKQNADTQRMVAESQRAQAVEETRRSEIMGRVAVRVMLIFGGLSALIIVLAGIALWRGEASLAEKVTIAAVVLVSTAFGRSSRR